jgi:hypothetical protein
LIGCSGIGRRIKNPDLSGTWGCRPPCWQGLVPGETSFEDALGKIDSQYSTEKTKDEFYRVGETNIDQLDVFYKTIFITRNEDEGNVRLFFDMGLKLNYINFIWLDIPLSDVVHDWGEPDTLYSYHEDGYVLCLLYKEIAANFCTLQEWENKEQIIPEEDTSIWSVSFIDPEYLDRYIDVYFPVSYSKWPGFNLPIYP